MSLRCGHHGRLLDINRGGVTRVNQGKLLLEGARLDVLGQLLRTLIAANVDQCLTVYSVEARAATFSKPDLEGYFAGQGVHQGQALTLPVVGAEKGLLKLFLECIPMGQVES